MTRSCERSAEAIEFARTQRQEANEFAWTVWQWIRGRKFHGQKFRREVPIGPYTADFCCIENKLIIEIDCEPHFTEEGLAKDRVRDRHLQDLGYKVLRFHGYDVIRDDGKAHERILQFVLDAISAQAPQPRPLLP
ncbi:MAG: endonuclease domain-containing protein [Pirellulaceae bacterium]|nr:endonuclease domain-containing protein [Pirellulaceae bacterium]